MRNFLLFVVILFNIERFFLTHFWKMLSFALASGYYKSIGLDSYFLFATILFIAYIYFFYDEFVYRIDELTIQSKTVWNDENIAFEMSKKEAYDRVDLAIEKFWNCVCRSPIYQNEMEKKYLAKMKDSGLLDSYSHYFGDVEKDKSSFLTPEEINKVLRNGAEFIKNDNGDKNEL